MTWDDGRHLTGTHLLPGVMLTAPRALFLLNSLSGLKRKCCDPICKGRERGILELKRPASGHHGPGVCGRAAGLSHGLETAGDRGARGRSVRLGDSPSFGITAAGFSVDTGRAPASLRRTRTSCVVSCLVTQPLPSPVTRMAQGHQRGHRTLPHSQQREGPADG